MPSRAAARLAAVAVVLLVLQLAGVSTAGADTSLSVGVGSSQQGQAMQPGFVGLSLEYTALHVYAGSNPKALNPVFLALVRALAPGTSPQLRIGGNSSDATWWPMPGTLPPAGVSYSLTKGWVAVAHAVAASLDARLVLGVNLAANSPRLAATEARALVSGVGRRYIRALEIGNEPDLYPVGPWYATRTGRLYNARPAGYSLQDFMQQFQQWRQVLPPGVPIEGPTLALGTWMTDLGQFLSAEPGLAAVTFHRYPLRSCPGSTNPATFTTIPNLMADSSSAGLAQQVAPFVAVAHQNGVAFRLDELNSSSCKGTLGVSNAFASALWVLNTLFNMANVGVNGVNIHTLPGAPYAPFSFTDTRGHWSGTVNPMYYGMLMFTQAFPAGAHLLNVDAPAGAVKAWATQDASGRIRIVLINTDPANTADVSLTYPGGGQAPLSSEALSAPSLAATTGVTLGGQSFGASTTTGVLPPPQTTAVAPANGAYGVAVPPASAVLLSTG